MAFTLSPNMNLTIPIAGETSGPEYAEDINNSLTYIDSHDHTPGRGAAITPAGISINAALPMNNNFITGIAGLTLQPQVSTPAIGTMYENGVDLYYVDGLGNNIRITQSGGIAGAPGSISNLVPPASASYSVVSSTFVWQSNTNIAANMDFGSAIFRNLSPNSTFGITVQAPAGLISNSTLTLPPIPSSQKIMTLDNSGNITAPYTVDNSTIVVAANIIKVPTGGITSNEIASGTIVNADIADNTINNAKLLNSTIDSTKIAAQGITRTNMYTGGVVDSASCGTFSTTNASPTQVTNLSRSIAITGGRPVMVLLIADGTTSECTFGLNNAIDSQAQMFVQISRGGTQVARYKFVTPGPSALVTRTPANLMFMDDGLVAGTYTYTVEIWGASTNTVSRLEFAKLRVYEL